MTPSKSNPLKSVKGKSRKPAAKERRTEILLEDMNGKMTVLADGHQMLVERMDRLETKMEEGFKDQNQKRNLATQALTKRIDSVTDEIRGLRNDVQPRLDDHEARITSLEGKPAA